MATVVSGVSYGLYSLGKVSLHEWCMQSEAFVLTVISSATYTL